MSTRIIFDQATSNTAKLMAQAINTILKGTGEGRRVKAILDSSTSGATYSALAAELGGGITTQQAQDAWTIFSNVMAVLDGHSPVSDPGAAIAELARLDQG